MTQYEDLDIIAVVECILEVRDKPGKQAAKQEEEKKGDAQQLIRPAAMNQQ